MTNLFIPEKIKVGYQERKGTYTNKLAYIIYYDEKGKLRKERSWQSWRDEKIDADDFTNEPTTGFVLNKSVERYNWSSHGTGRSMIRIYDPRGVEFEITTYNLIGLLMECDCNKRMLDGEFVYAWAGTELMLLPCGSESYKEAVEHTERQGQRISARELVEGRSYTNKTGQEMIYIGRFPWYRWRPSTDAAHGRSVKKEHIFWDGRSFNRVASIPNTLSVCNSEEPVQEYASLVDNLQTDIRLRDVVDWKIRKPIKNLEVQGRAYGGLEVKDNKFFKDNGEYIQELQVTVESKYNHDKKGYEPIGFQLYKGYKLDKETLKVSHDRQRQRGYGYYPSKRQNYTEEEIIKLLDGAGRELLAVLDTKKTCEIKHIGTWGMPGQR